MAIMEQEANDGFFILVSIEKKYSENIFTFSVIYECVKKRKIRN